LFIRKDINDRLGGFDEDYFLFSEEADYCFRAKNTINTKIIYFPKSKIFHEAGAITKKTPSKRIYLNYNSRLLFINKNYKYFYSLIFRYVVIVLFLKKIISLKISNKKNIIDYCNYYKKIIKIYFHNSPEFNER
jgi:hypothetical protein